MLILLQAAGSALDYVSTDLLQMQLLGQSGFWTSFFGYKRCWIDFFFKKTYNYNIFKDKEALWNLFDKSTNPVLEGSVFMCNHVPKASPRDLSSKIPSLSNQRKYKHFRQAEIETVTDVFAFKHTFKDILKDFSKAGELISDKKYGNTRNKKNQKT
jgi:hypothetical protein